MLCLVPILVGSLLRRSKRRQQAREEKDDCATLVGSLYEEKKGSVDSPTPTATDSTERLTKLRGLMREEGVNWYLVPTNDAHGSEYVAAPDQRIAYISGFTGTAGTVLVSADSAHLFVDGRYHVQAADQVDKNWVLHKLGLAGVLNYKEVLLSKAGPELKLGLDPTLVGYDEAKALISALTAKSATTVFPSRNLIDVVWGDERPAPVLCEIHEHPLKYAGQPAGEKLDALREYLSKSYPEKSAFIVSALDEVAWVLNLRGASIPGNPVFPSYVVIPSEGPTILFVPSNLLPDNSAAREYLSGFNVEVRDYEAVWEYLRSGPWARSPSGADANELGSEPAAKPKLVSGEKISWAVVNAVGDENVDILITSPLALAKACKNPTELSGFRASYLRDGAHWARWAAWLDYQVREQRHDISEHDAAVAFAHFRSQDSLYAGFDAYDAISASGPNAALPHYETPEHNSRIIDRKTPYLNDSGAQYLDGTIDTTRTVHFGRPTAEQRRAFTRVLQGHIAIDTAVFPAGTTGAQLDVLARSPLWRDGRDYRHGTGHGIGSYGPVHEGPAGFSTSSGGSLHPTPFLPGMTLSNEPGFYVEGHYGIRTESVLGVCKVNTDIKFGGDVWLGFERFTKVPIDRNLVDFGLLEKSEKKWLEEHNREVREALLPLVKHDKRAVRWLKRQ